MARKVLAHRLYATIQMLNTTSSRLASVLYLLASEQEVDSFVWKELSDNLRMVSEELSRIAEMLRG